MTGTKRKGALSAIYKQTSASSSADTGLAMSNVTGNDGSNLWYQVDDIADAAWDKAHTPTIYDGGVAVAAADILEIDYAGGAVKLASAASGAVTADAHKFALAQVGGFRSHDITVNMEQVDCATYESYDENGALVADEDTYSATQLSGEGRGDGFWTSTASELTESQGSNKDLKYTSRLFGTLGDLISREYQTAGNNTALSVEVDGYDIIVHNATDGGGVATSTALQIRDAIRASPPASALVKVNLASGSTGAGVPGTQAHTHLDGGVNPDLASFFDEEHILVAYWDKGTSKVRTVGQVQFKQTARNLKSLKDLVGMSLSWNYTGMIYDYQVTA